MVAVSCSSLLGLGLIFAFFGGETYQIIGRGTILAQVPATDDVNAVSGVFPAAAELT